MCNCIKEIEDRIQRELSIKNEEWKDREITSVEFENAFFPLKGGLELTSPVKIEYDYLNRKGEEKHKKTSVNLNYRYCPYCGEKYEEGEENE